MISPGPGMGCQNRAMRSSVRERSCARSDLVDTSVKRASRLSLDRLLTVAWWVGPGSLIHLGVLLPNGQGDGYDAKAHVSPRTFRFLGSSRRANLPSTVGARSLYRHWVSVELLPNARLCVHIPSVDTDARTAEARMTNYAESEAATFPWWLVLLEGIFAAIFGILLLLAPGSTLVFLVQVLGFYLLIDGILRIVSMFTDTSLWGLKLAIGIIGILAGIAVLQHPLWSALAVPTYIIYIIGFLAIFQGAGGLIQAFRGGGWGAGILGILSIIFGIIVLSNPLIGVVALPFVLGGFMLAGGIAAIVVSFRLRSSPTATGA